jgi:pimeloyl-ACP methyl ester carboxylesterase
MMEWLNILKARLRALFRRESVLRDIEEELRVHVELATEENLKRGLPPDEARTAAQNSFGHLNRNTDNDSIIKAPERAALKALYPQAQVHTFIGAGHGASIIKREEYLSVVKAFLRT